MEHMPVFGAFENSFRKVENPHQRNVIYTEEKKQRNAKERDERRPRRPDVEELQRTDEFYKNTKSLLVLFQIMGVVPIERSVGNTTWSWSSKPMIYAYVLFTVETIYVMVVFIDRLHITLLPGKRFDEYIYNFIFLSILIPHFLMPLASWRGGPEVAIYKNMWTHFQNKYYRITGEIMDFPNLEIITWMCCIVSWMVSISVMLAQYYLQQDLLLWHIFGYFHILAMLDCLCSLWFINCLSQGRASKGIAIYLQKALESPDSAKKISECRGLWLDLAVLMEQLGRANSGMLGMFCILIFLITTVATYGCLSEIMDHGISDKENGLVLIVLYTMGILYIICNEAFQVSKKMGLDFQSRLLNVNFAALDPDTQNEIGMFLTCIDKNPPRMNLNGYINFDRRLITSVMSTMATYLVMLMQFKMSLNRSNSKAQGLYNATLRAMNSTMQTPGNITATFPEKIADI